MSEATAYTRFLVEAKQVVAALKEVDDFDLDCRDPLNLLVFNNLTQTLDTHCLALIGIVLSSHDKLLDSIIKEETWEEAKQNNESLQS